jgi:hypothetical protein
MSSMELLLEDVNRAGLAASDSHRQDSRSGAMIRRVRNPALGVGVFVWLILSVFTCGVSVWAQSQQAPASPATQNALPASPGTTRSVPEGSSGQAVAGSISGNVTDQSGSAIIGAHVVVSCESQPFIQEAVSGDNGEFSFSNVPPGPFQLTVTAKAFNGESVPGTLHPGEAYTVPRIVLDVAAFVTNVKVTPPRAEMAKYQLQEQEKQRVLGFIPNFYVTYFADTVPLKSGQKFNLAFKTMRDPVTFAGMGFVAGVEQGLDSYSGYGQGMQGYAKRFGAAYADVATSTFIGSAVLPSLLKQDPRYFYRGKGSVPFRIVYAIGNSVICKGDNGHWQPNYSKVLGDLASGGISNLYYPTMDRGGLKLAYENAIFAAAITATANLLNEFLIPKLPTHFLSLRAGKP